jgi:hypothetical protein
VRPRTACRRSNPHQAVKNKDRNYTRSSLREFIPDADERLSDYLERLDRRNAAGTTVVAREPRTSKNSRPCARSAPPYKAMPARLEYGSPYEGRRRLQRSDRGRRQQQADCCGRSAAWRTDAWRRCEMPARPSTIILQQSMTSSGWGRCWLQHKEAVELPLRLDLVGIKAKRSPPTVLRQRRKPALPTSALSPLYACAKARPRSKHANDLAQICRSVLSTASATERGRRCPSPPPDGCGRQCSVPGLAS